MPLCPYCGKEVDMENLKLDKPKKTFVLRNIELAYCPHCDKILGVVAHVV